jgi:hypothetical protein
VHTNKMNVYTVTVSGNCIFKSINASNCSTVSLTVNASLIGQNAIFYDDTCFASLKASNVTCKNIYSNMSFSVSSYIKDPALVDQLSTIDLCIDNMNTSLLSIDTDIINISNTLSTKAEAGQTVNFSNCHVSNISFSSSSPFKLTNSPILLSNSSFNYTADCIGFTNLIQIPSSVALKQKMNYTVVSTSLISGVYYVIGTCILNAPATGYSSYRYGLTLNNNGIFDDPTAVCTVNCTTLGSGGNGFVIPVSRFLTLTNPSSLYLMLSMSNTSVTVVAGSGIHYVRIA